MKKITNSKIILGILLIVLFQLCAGLTYAYFSVVVNGNEEAKTIEVGTTTLKLIYIDSLEVTASDIYPGWSITKTVTVENTGTDKVYYSLGWQNLTNTVENEELIIDASCDTCGDVKKAIEYTEGTVAEANKVVYPIKEEIEINAGETQTYTLIFTFKETGSAQNYNQGKVFTGVLGIAESTKTYTVAGIVEDESGNKIEGVTVTIDALDTRTSNSVSKYKTQLLATEVNPDNYNSFTIPNIEVGNYVLNVKDSNGNNIGSKNITITSGEDVIVDGELITADKESKTIFVKLKVKDNTISSIETSQTLLNKMLSADTPQSDAGIDFTKDKDGCYFDFGTYTLICPEGCSVDPNTSEITCEEGKGDTNGKGLYYTSDVSKTEDNKTVYYYRGDVNNNYVVFAGQCFRIVRTNEDGSIKLVNRGRAKFDSNDNYICPTYENITAPITNTKFNTSSNDNAYVGYMYGNLDELDISDVPTYPDSPVNSKNKNYNAKLMEQVIPSGYGSKSYEQAHENINDSTIKTKIDTWYENAFNENEKSLIADTIYCNDRSLAEGEFDYWGDTVINTEISGYGQNETYYGGLKRLFTGTPQYKCLQENDKFTVSKSKGNGALKYPIALLTVDEAMYAGSIFAPSSFNYLYLENEEWLITASAFDGGLAYELSLGGGNVFRGGVNYHNAAFPAISLSSNTQIISGDGTINNPYVVAQTEYHRGYLPK